MEVTGNLMRVRNENLLYSTGNSTQHSAMTSTGEDSKKQWIMCIIDSLYYTAS